MSEQIYDAVIVGGGPAGLAAAVSAYDSGSRNIIILERDSRLGGILLQCIHNGFGLHYFGEELTGPEYAERFSTEVQSLDIEYKTDTMVLDISTTDGMASSCVKQDNSTENSFHMVTAINAKDGLIFIKTKAIILAMGCRE